MSTQLRKASSTRTRTRPPSTVRTAVIGLGMGWHHIAPFRKHPQCEVVTVCDVDKAKVDHAQREFDIPHGFTSIDDLLNFREFDLVSIALPNHLHVSTTLKFLKRGYHVLAEKPLAMNAREGKRIVAAAKAAGVKVSMHMNQRMTPEHQLIRRAFDAGDLGDIQYIRAGWMRKRGIPTWGSGWFYSKEKSGGGPLIDIGVHMLDSALYCCGFPSVVTVTGDTRQVFAEKDVPSGKMDVEDFATAYIRCAGGVTIVLEASWAGYHDEREEAYMHVYGSKAGAHRSTVFAPDWVPTTSFHFSRRAYGALTRETVEEYPDDIKSVQEDLVDAILEDREPVCTIEQGLVVQQVLDAIYRSAKTGREVRV